MRSSFNSPKTAKTTNEKWKKFFFFLLSVMMSNKL